MRGTSRSCVPILVALLGLWILVAACGIANTAAPAGVEGPSATPSATLEPSPTAAASSTPAVGANEEERRQPEALSGQRGRSELPSAAEREQLPSCDGAAFSVAPVDPALLSEITPLGNVHPPDHTTPTEHTYLHFADAQERTTAVYPLYAPGDVTLLLVRSSTGFEDPEDHSISFALCEDVYGYFNHVKFLSDEVVALLAGTECAAYSGDTSGSCERPLFASVPAGTPLGQVGRLQGNFDFGALDMRVTHTFANADRYRYARTPHIVCPYDYYEGALQEELYELLPRTEEPYCGVVVLDEPGTLQGVWYQPGSDAVVGWDQHLAFVTDNYDPAIAVIAVGGTFSEPGRVEFTPATSGAINRSFADVTADGSLYCYERDGSGRHERVQNPDLLSGKILVQLVGATELRIERQSGRCGTSEAFSAPTTYFR